MISTSIHEVGRPGDGNLAEHDRRAALTTHQKTAGEESMVERNEQGWRARAACRAVDPETFFPAAKAGVARDRQVARAKRVCRRCPVQASCLRWAMDALPHGIAGGMTEDERRRSRRAAVRRAKRAEVRAAEQRPERHRSDRAEVIAAGRAAIADGMPREEIARSMGVTRRTVDRWAAMTPPSTGGGR